MDANKKKLVFIMIPAMALLVGFLVWDEFFKDDMNSSEEVEKGPIVYADEAFIDGNEVIEAKTTTQNKVNLLKDKHKREKVASLIDRNVISHEDFFGKVADEATEDINDAFLKDDKPILEANINSVVPTQKQKIVYVPVKEKTQIVDEPPKRRTRDKDAMFKSANTSKILNGAASINGTTVSAVVHGDYSVRSGQNVTLRLTNDVEINGQVIPRNSYINATTSFGRDRIELKVQAITLKDKIVNVKTKIFDVYDNQEGIYVPGGVEKEIKDNLVGDAISETARRINVPGIGSVKVGSKKKAKDPIINIGSGHKLLIQFI